MIDHHWARILPWRKTMEEKTYEAPQRSGASDWTKGLVATVVFLAAFLVAKLCGHLVRGEFGKRGNAAFALTEL